jgi:hypothetical protein
MTSTANAEPKGSEPSSTDSLNELCRCGHQRRRHLEPPGAQCVACPGDSERSWRHEFAPEEPPLTPEEEEQAPEDPGYACANVSGCAYVAEDVSICKRGCRVAADELSREANEMEPPPPQPGRRPPYAVAYSVQGHLYEVALPGDATVRAVDGALVIQHHLGPVAGIVSVLPIINEESRD